MQQRVSLTAVVLALAIAACSGVNVKLGSSQQSDGTMGGNGASAAGGMAVTSGGGGTLNLIDAGNDPVPCPAGSPTTLSGIVKDPAGKVPLYNAVVFIPDPAVGLKPLGNTVACEACGEKLPALDVALTDASGSFELKDSVPNTPTVDVVVQLGKWRTKPQALAIDPCHPNPIPDGVLHLPRSKAEGDLPKIALSTGHSDALECLLLKIGIDRSEFTTDQGQGSVNMFVGCEGDQVDKHTGAAKFDDGTPFPSTNKLFDTPGELDHYDAVIFSCEGHKCTATQSSGEPAIQSPAHVAQLVDFADRGGRVYLDHDHYNWLNHAGDVANATPADKATESSAQFNSSSGDIPSPLAAQINTTNFPKGRDFAHWLVNVNASTALGTLNIYSAKTSVTSLSPNRAQSWIYRDSTQDYPDFFYFTIGTPVAIQDSDPPPEACGRMVFTDLHVSKSDGGCDPTSTTCGESDDISDQDTPFPNGCTSSGLLPQEKALEFMIFDLTSCVQKETLPPTLPVIVK